MTENKFSKQWKDDTPDYLMEESDLPWDVNTARDMCIVHLVAEPCPNVRGLYCGRTVIRNRHYI